MFAVLALLFLVVPFVELFVIIQVGQSLGVVPTIVLLIAISVAGAAMVKREGLATLRRARASLDAGRVPGRELVDGVLILFAGALLLTPGFFTDLLGILLLIPPVRAALRAAALRYLERRAGLSGPDRRGLRF